MATKPSATRTSKPSAKSAVKPTSASKEPPAVVDDSEGAQESGQRQRSASPLGSTPSLVERIEAERDQIMKALSIIECCKNASATMLDVDDSEYMVPAFETVYDLLNTSAGELERIAKAVQRLTKSSD